MFRKCSAEIILIYVPDLCLTSSQLYDPNVIVILKCTCHLDYVESPQNIYIYKTDSTDVVFYFSGQNGSYTTFLILSEIPFPPLNPVPLTTGTTCPRRLLVCQRLSGTLEEFVLFVLTRSHQCLLPAPIRVLNRHLAAGGKAGGTCILLCPRCAQVEACPPEKVPY